MKTEEFWLNETYNFLGTMLEIVEHAKSLTDSFEEQLLFTESEHQDMRDRYEDIQHQLAAIQEKFEKIISA
jgi:hypothetical protein